MGRKAYKPDTNASSRRTLPYDTDNFGRGVIKDVPASDIPENSLADGENVIVYPTEVQGRTGSRLFTNTEVPPITGRTAYSGQKDGFIITADQNQFTLADVGNYWVWPGAETVQEEIIRYINGTHVEVATSGTIAWTAGCYLTGGRNLWAFHKVKKKWLFQFGREFWTADIDITTFTRVLIVSRDKPNNSFSGVSEFDDQSWMVYNSAGIFRVDLYAPDVMAYRVNVPIPHTKIDEQIQTADTNFQYGYIYSHARLSDHGWFRDRLTPTRIEVEGGTNRWDDAYQDFADVWTDEPIGVTTYPIGTLTGDTVLAPWNNHNSWIPFTDASFRATINDTREEIVSNLAGATSMAGVAAIFQREMRLFWALATCTWEDDDHFVISAGTIGGTVGYVDAGETGTNVAGIMNCTAAAGATIGNLTVGAANVCGPFYNSRIANTDPTVSSFYHWHLTHYPIYRTLDKDNEYKQGRDEAILNDPEEFVWVKDLRMAGAFWARKYNGHVLADIGQFEEADVGSVIEWENGDRDTILGYVAPDDVIISTSTYYGEETAYMAAEIGNGRVARSSQTGNTVTLDPDNMGTTFTEADIGRTIVWSTGYSSVITGFTSGTVVTVNDSIDKDRQGMTMDWTYRMFNDLTNDATLRTRLTALQVRSRFMESMANANEGVVVPGFMITAVRGESQFRYCQLEDAYEYFAGFHHKSYQISNAIKDDINKFLMFPNKFVALCTNRTWSGPTNTSTRIVIPNTNVIIFVLGGIDILDGTIGCYDWGSVEEVEFGVYQFLTSEPGGVGMRKFNGFSYGANELELVDLQQPTWAKEMTDLQRATGSIYDGVAGYLVWGRNKP